MVSWASQSNFLYVIFLLFFKVRENEMFDNVTQLTDILNVGVCERSYNTLHNN